MNQVQINPTKLSILSIKRSKYWIFKSAILELLHSQANKGNEDASEDESEDSDGDEDDITNRFRSLSTKQNNNLNDYLSVSSESNTSQRRGKKHGSLSSTSSNSNEHHELDNSSKNNFASSPLEAQSSYDSLSDSEESNFFFHIAFTPIECTIICSAVLLKSLFQEPLSICKNLNYDDVTVLEQKFVTLQIDSGGSYSNNYRILQLTRPLSQNNISLFFLSSHFSDIVLIPYELEDKVITILTNNNFEFNDLSGSYIINNNNESGPRSQSSHVHKTDDLENKIFKLFKESNIKPVVDKKISLLLTGARSSDVQETILKVANNIASNRIPDYLAITRTSDNEVSLILPKSSKERKKLGFESKALIGSTQDVINPITIDLQKLPLDSTGIVAGVASKIINGVTYLTRNTNYPFELNYLSMARSGILLIPKENVELVEEILDNIDYEEL